MLCLVKRRHLLSSEGLSTAGAKLGEYFTSLLAAMKVIVDENTSS